MVIEQNRIVCIVKMKIETYMRELDIGRSRVCLEIKKIFFFIKTLSKKII